MKKKNNNNSEVDRKNDGEGKKQNSAMNERTGERIWMRKSETETHGQRNKIEWAYNMYKTAKAQWKIAMTEIQ